MQPGVRRAEPQEDHPVAGGGVHRRGAGDAGRTARRRPRRRGPRHRAGEGRQDAGQVRAGPGDRRRRMPARPRRPAPPPRRPLRRGGRRGEPPARRGQRRPDRAVVVAAGGGAVALQRPRRVRARHRARGVGLRRLAAVAARTVATRSTPTSTGSATRPPDRIQPTPHPEDFHKHFRAFLHDFATRIASTALAEVLGREIVQICTILLVEIFARVRGWRWRRSRPSGRRAPGRGSPWSRWPGCRTRRGRRGACRSRAP